MTQSQPGPTDWANPAVIGLMGFGMTTMVTGISNIQNSNVTLHSALSLAFIWGGLAQFIAGWVALKKGNIFAGSAFVGYGAFWIALFLFVGGIGIPVAAGKNDLLAFWFVWTLFTLTFLINAWKHGPGIFGVFLLLFIAFVLLDIVAYGGTSISTTFVTATGYEIFIDGLLAWYVATAIEVETHYGRKLLPF